MDSKSWNGILIAVFGLFLIVIAGAAASISNEPSTRRPPQSLYQNRVIYTEEIVDEVEPQNVVIRPQSVVTPTPEIVERPKPKPQPKGRWIWAKVTAYCPCAICCGSHANGKTSTMVNTKSGRPEHAYGYAVDPRAIPYGTRIHIPDYWNSLQRNISFVPTKPLVADDTGVAMRRSFNNGVIHIDCRYRTHRAAIKWGTRRMRVFLYDD
jgi:3D (Asp-Asp-Asp) domain-containing protein